MNAHEPLIPDFGRVAGAWQKWESLLRPCYDSLNDLLLKAACIQNGDNVLDLGCGSGDFAMLEAAKVGENGRVTGIDISEEMLAIARRTANERGVTNIEFLKQDADTLSFRDPSFDAITARFCFMFLKSPEKTLHQIRCILKPGRTFAACVWGSVDKNPLPRKALERYVDFPGEDPQIPGPFRFGADGILMDMMNSVGFQKSSEEEILIQEKFTDGRQYADHLLESSGTWGGLLMKLPQDTLTEATHALIEAAEQYRTGDHLSIPRCAKIVSGS